MIGDFLKKGKKVEAAFFAKTKFIREATRQEDMKEHWDGLCEEFGKVDVKGMKKLDRNDEEPNEHIHWIEIKNVKGERGWAFGDADHFAFELKSYWIVISKDKLKEVLTDKVIKIRTEKKELYHLYQRKGRKDLITLVRSYDLCAYATKILKK